MDTTTKAAVIGAAATILASYLGFAAAKYAARRRVETGKGAIELRANQLLNDRTNSLLDQQQEDIRGMREEMRQMRDQQLLVQQQNLILQQQVNEWQTKYNALDVEYKLLKTENQRLEERIRDLEKSKCLEVERGNEFA